MRPGDIDVAIFGGGIAGLWTLARLQQMGYNAWLFESTALGGVQTVASQGIIHGGTKYALDGKLDRSAQAIARMPGRWQSCLQGRGELDLSRVRVNSAHQYLWSSGTAGSRLAGFFAGKMMRSRVSSPTRDAYLPPFNHKAFHGTLYQLQEPVLDVTTLVAELVRQTGERCIKLDQGGLRRAADRFNVTDRNGVPVARARAVVFSAGAGNINLLRYLDLDAPQMQLRPLHMVMLRGQLPELYAHALGISKLPLVTATTAEAGAGETVWYLGGQLAEQGVQLQAEDQIRKARDLLGGLLSWVDLTETRWATLRVDRAEGQMADGSRPADCFVRGQEGIITVWPTKLAFAPRVGDQVVESLAGMGMAPGKTFGRPFLTEQPPLAQPPWKEAREWS